MIKSFHDLRDEMKAVARGDIPPPADHPKVLFSSAAAVAQLLTPENRELLRLIRDERPSSIEALAQMSGKAQPNVSRSLEKLERAGLIRMHAGPGKTKQPEVIVRTVRIEIDVCGHDQMTAIA